MSEMTDIIIQQNHVGSVIKVKVAMGQAGLTGLSVLMCIHSYFHFVPAS